MNGENDFVAGVDVDRVEDGRISSLVGSAFTSSFFLFSFRITRRTQITTF